MGNLLYIVAVILIIAWAIGFFVYSAGSIIHVLLVIAIIAIVVKLVQGKRDEMFGKLQIKLGKSKDELDKIIASL